MLVISMGTFKCYFELGELPGMLNASERNYIRPSFDFPHLHQGVYVP